MKFLTATTVFSLLAAASTSEAANRHNGVRRSINLSPLGSAAQRHSTNTLHKRMPLGGLPAEQPKMMKSLKRAPLDYEKREPQSDHGFGAMPILENRGMSSIMGLTERTLAHVKRAWSHDGKQGSSKEVAVSSSDSDDTSSDGDDADAEECDEEDGDVDDEQCEDTEDDDEDDDCDDDEDDSDDTSTATSSASSASSTSSASSDDSIGGAIDSVVQNVANIKSTRTSSSASASSTASSTASADGTKNTGTATWFLQNGNPGNCGEYNSDSVKLIALYSGVYDNGKNCGRKVQINNLQDGTSTTALVMDSCPTCGGPEDIDLSVGAMSALDPNYKTNGIRKVEWYYID